MKVDSQSATEALREEIAQARVTFGKNLARWRRLNNWSQDTPEQWGRAAGFPYVHNSQWSRMERGLHTMPGPLVFRCLGVLNVKIALEEWGAIASSALRDRVQNAQAIRDPESGMPWQGEDFYGAFIGRRDWPPFPKRQPVMSSAEAEAWNRQLRLWFEELTTAAGLLPLQSLQGLMEHVPQDQQATLQQALMSMGGFTPGELQRLHVNQEMAPKQWLEAWSKGLGLSIPLELSRHWRLVPEIANEDEEVEH